jgi:hypothetical protein
MLRKFFGWLLLIAGLLCVLTAFLEGIVLPVILLVRHEHMIWWRICGFPIDLTKALCLFDFANILYFRRYVYSWKWVLILIISGICSFLLLMLWKGKLIHVNIITNPIEALSLFGYFLGGFIIYRLVAFWFSSPEQSLNKNK